MERQTSGGDWLLAVSFQLLAILRTGFVILVVASRYLGNACSPPSASLRAGYGTEDTEIFSNLEDETLVIAMIKQPGMGKRQGRGKKIAPPFRAG
jgi:hypothetical protein